jgi:predicted house-cleaning noncanonical NTP pyrophosphatase (MazG superfamily)
MNLVKFQFNKLIRNKIHERMPGEGVIVNSSALSHAEFILKLKEKLLEEASEVSASQKIEDLVIELADTLEVIHALADACEIDFKDIEQARSEKSQINGEFTPDNYINYIEVEKHNTKVIDYQKDKNRHYKLEL